MPRGNHFVVHKPVFCSEVAFQAFLRAMNDVSRVVHSQRKGFFVWPRPCRVWTKPRGSRPMTVFARYAFGNFKRAPALLRRGVKRVTRETFRSFLGLRA